MVSIRETRGPYTVNAGSLKNIPTGKLFDDSEVERASCIAEALDGLTIQEATDLLERFKEYLNLSVFSSKMENLPTGVYRVGNTAHIQREGEIGIREINILGVVYQVNEVDVVDKEDLCKGKINYLTNEIRIDKGLVQSAKEQTLMHEILHAVFDLLGLDELNADENKVQGIATALHHVFTSQTIFPF